MRNVIMTAAILAACGPALAINKCTVDGKVVFQDAACTPGTGGQIVVRPAAGTAPPAAAMAPGIAASAVMSGTSAAAPTPTQRMEKHIADSQAARRRSELESLLVPNAKAAMEQTRTRCDAEFNVLRAQKSRANNNLAGATWESSLSQEMQAVTTRCDTQQREKKEEFETLRKECTGLGGCKQLL